MLSAMTTVPGLGSLLQAGGEIRRLPGHRFLFRCAFAEQIAHDHKTGGNANACLQQVLLHPTSMPLTALATASPARTARSAASSLARGQPK